MTFVQNGAPAHTSKVTQTWCHKNLPKLIPKDDWPANAPDLNPVENSWSITDEIRYRGPAPKTLDKLKKRPRFSWKNVTQDTLKELAHSMPCRLKAFSNTCTLRKPIMKKMEPQGGVIIFPVSRTL